MESTNSKPKLYALLIGINFYFPNRLSDGSEYGDLDGAVNDITDVENFLLRQPKQPDKIYKLTATSVEDATILDPPKAEESAENLPTYANIINYFDEITKQAEEGDLVYIHYSGHGGRAASTKPEIKSNNIDEALVPTDIGTGEGQYIRDWELAILLERMVKKGLVVTVILDSCHSGGSTRGGDAKARGLSGDVVDQTTRLRESLVNPSAEELEVVAPSWKKQKLKHATRGGTPVATMIPEAKGYVLLAACRPSELAYEYAFDESGESNGSLTYWLLDTLKQPSPGITYKMIYDRISGKINTQFPTQNPMILGEGDRVFLGKDYNSVPFAVTVTEVKLAEKLIKLDAGQATGLRKGSEFVIYPSGTADFSDKDLRLAVAKITKRGATESWAEITTVIKEKPAIDVGSQAVLTAVPVKLMKKIRLLRDNDVPEEREPALQAIESAITDNGWVRLVAEDGEKKESADYQVDVKALDLETAKTYHLEEGEVIYEICDRAGDPIILRPAIEVNDAKAATNLVKRLVHLAKYQAAEELDNHDANSKLKGKIEIEILGKMSPDDYEPGDPSDPEPFEDPDNPTLKVDEYLFIKIHNKHSEVLNFTVLDLVSDWQIAQIEPNTQISSANYTPLDPGESKEITLSMSLPKGEKTGSDIFKVFATVGSANFRWLELPSLDEPIPKSSTRGFRSLGNPLDDLLKSLAAEKAPTRTANPVVASSQQWTTTKVKIRLEK
ncbi:MAG: caspase family protein [Cyanobacteria bacterium P01_F01_bin.143]